MADRNTIMGWVLGAGICALGFSIVSGKYYASHRPHKMGFVIQGVVEEGAATAEAGPPIEVLLASADPAKGAEVFKKCASCHSIEQGGANGTGPNLWGALGKPHGHVAGFAYSEALKAVPGNWDFKGMDAWLASPRKYAPGTKMSFAGLGSGEDRANVIAYLNSMGSNLPLPAAAPAAAPVATPSTGAEAPAAPTAAPAPAAK
jgi:cytochrome c